MATSALLLRLRGTKLFCYVVMPLLVLAVRARLLTPQKADDLAMRWLRRFVRIEVVK